MFKNVFKYVIASVIILIFATGSFAQNTKTSVSSPVDATINSLSRVLVNGQMVVFNTGTSVLAIGDAVELDTSWTWLLDAQTSLSLNLAMMLPDSFTYSINDSIQNGWWQLGFEYADSTGIGSDADTLIIVGTIFDSDSVGNTFTGFVDTVSMSGVANIFVLSDYHWSRIDSIDGFLFDNGVTLNVKASLLRSVVASTNLLRAVGTLTDSLFADSSGAMAVFGSGLGWANIDGFSIKVRPGTRIEPTSGSDWIRSLFADSLQNLGRAHIMGLPISLEQVVRDDAKWKRIIIR